MSLILCLSASHLLWLGSNQTGKKVHKGGDDCPMVHDGRQYRVGNEDQDEWRLLLGAHKGPRQQATAHGGHGHACLLVAGGVQTYQPHDNGDDMMVNLLQHLDAFGVYQRWKW